MTILMKNSWLGNQISQIYWDHEFSFFKGLEQNFENQILSHLL